jgi:threonine-phosphate decarboxylase
MCNHSLPDHGGQLRALAARFRVPEESLLDFSASINPFPPDDALIDTLCESLRRRKILTCYPDAEYTELKRAIARYLGFEAGSICVGNGAMSLLTAAASALDIRRCLVLVPAFSEYKRALGISGTYFTTLALSAEDGFMVDSDHVLAQVKKTGAQALLIANPQSPSGSIMPAAQLSQLQQAASDCGVTTIIDEAFIDYVPEESLAGIAVHTGKLIVIRSITKFFAMPGLRVGYAVAHPEICNSMGTAMPLWVVDSIAAEAACLVLRDTDSIKATRTINAAERDWLLDQFRMIGITVFPAAANFLLIKVDETRGGLELWRRLILDYGIVVRSCASFEGLNQQYFRVGVRTHSENKRLITALRDLTRR